jgi:large subunit ribosomal protein L3
MLAALIGKKIGMTQVFDDLGVLHVVTVVQAGPCSVLQVKTTETDGYNAVQLGFGERKAHTATRPAIGHAGKVGCKPPRAIRELRLGDGEAADVEAGATLTVDTFEGVSHVDVVGTSKGKGFAGVMKRHNFKGLEASHGVKRKHRSAGSIGGHATNLGTAGNIKKGKRMAGHMGHERCTTRNHKLVNIDTENNLLLIKGAIPGPNGGMVFVKHSTTAKVSK